MTAGADPIFDIAIAGASHTGLAAALALKHVLGGDLRLGVIERGRPEVRSPAADVRAFAISAGSRRLLEVIGIWSRLAPHAQPVHRIDITDSALDDAIRPVLLTYDNHVGDAEAATHIVPVEQLQAALRDAVRTTSGLTVVPTSGISNAIALRDHAEVTLGDASGATGTLRTRLLIAADGRASPVRDMMGIRCLSWSTGQTGIVTIVRHERPHEGHAVQHFLPAGPFAILPMTGDRSCVTWSEGTTRAHEIF